MTLGLLIFIYCSLFLSSCSQQSQEPISIPTQDVTKTSKIIGSLSVKTAIPTTNFTPSTALLEYTKHVDIPTSAPTPSDQILEEIPECFSNGGPIPLPEDLHFPGRLIYQDNKMQQLYVAGDEPLTAPVNKLHSFGFSTDNRWQAYSDTGLYEGGDLLNSPPTLRLISREGEIIDQTISLTPFQRLLDQYYADRISGWRIAANDYRWLESDLIPVTISLLTETTTRSNVLFVYGFLNPFSGEWKDITTYQLPEWQPVIYPAFSANMSEVLYARYSKNKVVLWDIEEEKLIWEREEPNIYHQTIEWTKDGERAAIMLRLNEGITTVTRFGEEHYIPFIGDYPEIWSIGFSFSPNESFLAIINRKREIDSTSSDYEIGIYSFEAKQYVYKCPIIADIDLMVNRLVWSPDNRYLATSFTNIELRDTFTPLLVYDIVTGNVYHLASDGSAVGWLEEWH
jgi:hypothetical protein